MPLFASRASKSLHVLTTITSNTHTPTQSPHFHQNAIEPDATSDSTRSSEDGHGCRSVVERAGKSMSSDGNRASCETEHTCEGNSRFSYNANTHTNIDHTYASGSGPRSRSCVITPLPDRTVSYTDVSMDGTLWPREMEQKVEDWTGREGIHKRLENLSTEERSRTHTDLSLSVNEEE